MAVPWAALARNWQLGVGPMALSRVPRVTPPSRGARESAMLRPLGSGGGLLQGQWLVLELRSLGNQVAGNPNVPSTLR